MTEDRQRFLYHWIENIMEDDYLCYDITAVSTYAKTNEYSYFGYNRDNFEFPKCASYRKSLSLFGPSEQNKEAQYDVSHYPHGYNEHYTNSSTYLRACTLSPLHPFHAFSGRPYTTDKPYQHKDVESNEEPFENFTHHASLWFFECKTAVWTRKRSITNFVGTLWTFEQWH